MMSPAPPDERPPWPVVLGRIRRDLTDGRTSILAGGVAFYCFLALFPALTALVSLYGLVADPQDVARQLDALAPILPAPLRGVMEEELTRLASGASATLSIELTVGILVALWAANKGTRALLIAVAAVFDPGRAGNIVRLSVVALRLTAAAAVFGVLSLAAIVALPATLARLGLGSPGLRLMVWLRWPFLAALLLVGLASMYRVGRPGPARWRWVTYGSALATTLWLLGSGAFSWFVSSHTSHYRLDGSMAAIAVLLSWFLMSAYVVLLGAVVDAARERTRPD
jgi:membrane protein